MVVGTEVEQETASFPRDVHVNGWILEGIVDQARMKDRLHDTDPAANICTRAQVVKRASLYFRGHPHDVETVVHVEYLSRDTPRQVGG